MVQRSVEELEKRHEYIVKTVERKYPISEDFDMLSAKIQDAMGVGCLGSSTGLNSGNYDINLIKQYFVD